MLSQTKLDRINELSRKQRSVGLSPAERKEQQQLRQAYLQVFRENFRTQLQAQGLVQKVEQTSCGCGDAKCKHHHHHHGLPH